MNNIDLYSTMTLLRAIELMPREYSFFYDTFCQDAGAVEDDEAIYDFRKGLTPMAPFVHPGAGGILMPRGEYETRKIGFTTIAPERLIDPANLNKRMFGENVLGSMTPERRARAIQTADLVDMRKAIQRRREWMAREVILTGKLDIFRYTENGRDLKTTMVADYNFTNHYTPETQWDQAGANINDDMRKIYDLVYDGLGDAELMVMAPDVWAVMEQNETYMKTFDRSAADMGEIKTRYKGSGLRFIGRNIDGVEVWTHSGYFLNDLGVKTASLPSGTLICGGRGILKAYHGPVTQVEGEGMTDMPKTYVKKEVPLHYADRKANTVSNRITSRPTIVPFNVDAWAVAHVL